MQVGIIAFHTQGARQITGVTINLTIEEQTFQETEKAGIFYVNMEVANMSLAGVTDSSGSHFSAFNTSRNPLQNNSSQTAMAKWIFPRAFCLPGPCLFAVIFPLCASVQMPLCMRLAWLTEASFSLYYGSPLSPQLQLVGCLTPWPSGSMLTMHLLYPELMSLLVSLLLSSSQI